MVIHISKHIISDAVQDLAGKKAEGPSTPYSKDSVIRFFEKCLNFISGGQYGQSLREKRQDEWLSTIEQLKNSIKDALLAKGVDGTFDSKVLAPGDFIEISSGTKMYTITQQANDEGLRISEGSDYHNGLEIKDIKSFNEIANNFNGTEQVEDEVYDHLPGFANRQMATTQAGQREPDSPPISTKRAAVPTPPIPTRSPESAAGKVAPVNMGQVNPAFSNFDEVDAAQAMARPESIALLDKLEKQQAILRDNLGTSQNKVGLYKELSQQVGDLNSSKRFATVPGAIFKDIPAAQHTMVTAPDGRQLSANRVQIGGVNRAIACQYPSKAHMNSYYKMLAENRTPVLVVLASDEDINGIKLINYFDEHVNIDQDGLKVTSKRVDDATFGNKLHARQYELTINDGRKSITIPVVHVHDWADFSAQDLAPMQNLVKHVDNVTEKQQAMYKKANSRAVGDPNKLLPVVHCRAGIGRTGQFLITQQLLQQPDISLEEMVTELRQTRNHVMVQTNDQLNALAELAAHMGVPLLKES